MPDLDIIDEQLDSNLLHEVIDKIERFIVKTTEICVEIKKRERRTKNIAINN